MALSHILKYKIVDIAVVLMFLQQLLIWEEDWA